MVVVEEVSVLVLQVVDEAVAQCSCQRRFLGQTKSFHVEHCHDAYAFTGVLPGSDLQGLMPSPSDLQS